MSSYLKIKKKIISELDHKEMVYCTDILNDDDKLIIIGRIPKN